MIELHSLSTLTCRFLIACKKKYTATNQRMGQSIFCYGVTNNYCTDPVSINREFKNLHFNLSSWEI